MINNELITPPIHFLKGGNNSYHKIKALQHLLPDIPIIPTIVNAEEPDHHKNPYVLVEAKFSAFYKAWRKPSGYTYLTLVADVTTDYGGQPIRKPTSTNLEELAREIAENTVKFSERRPSITLVEYAAILVNFGNLTRVGVSTTQTSFPTQHLSDYYLVQEALYASGLPEKTLLNISGGLDSASMLAFLHAKKRLDGKSPRDLVKLPKKFTKHLNSNRGYVYRRMEFYESNGRVNNQLQSQLDVITLLGLLESGLNMPGHLVLPLINSILATPLSTPQ